MKVPNNALGKIEIHMQIEIRTYQTYAEWLGFTTPLPLYVRNGNNISKYYADEKRFLYTAWSFATRYAYAYDSCCHRNFDFEVMYDHKGLIAHYCG